MHIVVFFFSSRRRHTRCGRDWSSDVCSSDLGPDAERRLLACGRPSVDCEIKLINDKGQDVPPGEQGEIALRAPFSMAGYLNAPDLNADMFLEGGWLRTRDVGRFDEEGYL